MRLSVGECAEICKKTAASCLFFQLAVVPLILDPFAFEFWYKPKIDSTYALVLMLGLAALVLRVACKVRLALPPRALCCFLALYGLSAIVSTIYSVDPEASLRGDYFRHESMVTLLVYALLPVLFTMLVFTRQQARMLLLGLAVCSAVAAAYALVQYAGFDPVTTAPFFGLQAGSGVRAVGSTLGNPNFLGKFLVLTAPLLLAFAHTGADWRKRFPAITALVLVVGGLIVTETRSSWAGFFIACCAFFFLVKDSGPRPKVLLGMLAAIICSGIVFISFVALARGKLPDLQNTLSKRTAVVFDVKKAFEASTRLYVWGKTIDCIARRPWFGFGPDTQVLVFRQFNREYNRRFNEKVVLDRAHNNYLDIALAQGFCGLVAYCGILISFLALLWQTLKRKPFGTDRIFLCAIFSGYCGYLVNDFFSFSVVSVSPTFWSLMGLTIALSKISLRETPDASAAG